MIRKSPLSAALLLGVLAAPSFGNNVREIKMEPSRPQPDIDSWLANQRYDPGPYRRPKKQRSAKEKRARQQERKNRKRK